MSDLQLRKDVWRPCKTCDGAGHLLKATDHSIVVCPSCKGTSGHYSKANSPLAQDVNNSIAKIQNEK